MQRSAAQLARDHCGASTAPLQHSLTLQHSPTLQHGQSAALRTTGFKVHACAPPQTHAQTDGRRRTGCGRARAPAWAKYENLMIIWPGAARTGQAVRLLSLVMARSLGLARAALELELGARRNP